MSDIVESFRNKVAYHLASLDASLAPYADRAEVQEFWEESRRALESLPSHLSLDPKSEIWIDRFNDGLNSISKLIMLNCKIIRLGFNPPGRDTYSWAVLAAVVGMEEFSLNNDSEVFRFLTRLEAKVISEDAAERRRVAATMPVQPSEQVESPLLALAQVLRLTGKQLKLVKMIATTGGPVPLPDIGLELEWFQEGQRSWLPSNNNDLGALMTPLNKKLRAHGWKVRRLNSNVEAVRIWPVLEK